MNAGRWASLLLLGVVLLSAEEGVADERGSGRCYGLRVRAADSPGERGGRRRTPVLSASEVKDLAFEVAIPQGAAGQPVRVKLFTPRGPLYQVLDAVADEEVRSEQEGRRRARRGARLVARFPVAGTPVTSHALFGKWRAEVYLDGAETPCARPLWFVLER